jgi:transposase
MFSGMTMDNNHLRIAELEAIVAQQAATIKSQALQIEKLISELLILNRRLFGRSSEAADLLQVQGQLFAPPETIACDAARAADASQEATPAPAPALPRTPKTSADEVKQQPKRELLPEGLPREEQVLDLPDDVKAGLVQIGTDVSERLAYRPGQFYVLRSLRPRYAAPQNPDAGVQQMPVPASVIPGGILDVSVLAEAAISKFADHMPLCRFIDRCTRLGVELSLSTLSVNLLTIAEVWLKSLLDLRYTKPVTPIKSC